jgi:hypothetical protein
MEIAYLTVGFMNQNKTEKTLKALQSAQNVSLKDTFLSLKRKANDMPKIDVI